jgi:signal transduction histidine kinase
MHIYRNAMGAIAALAFVAAGSQWALADNFGTRDEAVAMVKTVKADIQKDGLDAVAKEINAKKYNDRDLYPFVYKTDGTNVALGSNAALVGKNLIELKDQNGKLFIKEIIATATSSGSGWVDYLWPNPTTKKIEAKSSYVEKVDNGYVLGVGIYKK